MKCDALRNLLTLSYTRKSQVFTDLEGVLRNLETSYDANIRALSTEVLQKLSASQEIDDDVQQHQGGPNKRDETEDSHTEDGETEDTEPKQLRRWGRSQDLQGRKHLRSQAVGLRWGMKKPRTVPHEY